MKLVLCPNRDRIFLSNYSNLWYFRNFVVQFAKMKKDLLLCYLLPIFRHSQSVCLLQLQSVCVLPPVKLFVGKSFANKQCMYHGCIQYAKNMFYVFFWRATACWPLLRPIFFRDVWIRSQSAAVASRRAIPTHLPLMGSGNSESSPQLESNILLSFWSFYLLCFRNH